MTQENTTRRYRMTLRSQARATLWLHENAEAVKMMTLSDITDKLNREAALEHPVNDKNTSTLLAAIGFTCKATEDGVTRQKLYDKMLSLQGTIERQDVEIASLIKKVESLTKAVDLLSDTWAPVVSYGNGVSDN